MGCFCHKSLLSLGALLPSLDISASLALPGMGIPLGLSAYLNAAALPAEPWMPDPGWLTLPLPQLKLSMQAVATISAMASLRAQVLAQFGIDLLIPGQAMAMARIVATLNARMSLMANINPLAWLELARLNAAIDQVNLALSLGLLLPSPSMMLSLTVPGGIIPMPRWTSFTRAAEGAVPDDRRHRARLHRQPVGNLHGALRRGAAHHGPAVAPRARSPRDRWRGLTAALSAVASLQASLGISPLMLGFPAIQLRVQAEARRPEMPMLSAHFGISASPAQLPRAATVAAAPAPRHPQRARDQQRGGQPGDAGAGDGLAELAGAVTDPRGFQIGLPVCALALQLQASGSRSAPCCRRPAAQAATPRETRQRPPRPPEQSLLRRGEHVAAPLPRPRQSVQYGLAAEGLTDRKKPVLHFALKLPKSPSLQIPEGLCASVLKWDGRAALGHHPSHRTKYSPKLRASTG